MRHPGVYLAHETILVTRPEHVRVAGLRGNFFGAAVCVAFCAIEKMCRSQSNGQNDSDGKQCTLIVTCTVPVKVTGTWVQKEGNAACGVRG